jgi:hypothetical protein
MAYRTCIKKFIWNFWGKIPLERAGMILWNKVKMNENSILLGRTLNRWSDQLQAFRKVRYSCIFRDKQKSACL